MKYLSILIIIIIFSSCNSIEIGNFTPIKKEANLLKIVDSIGLRSLYDSAKWQIYLLNYNDTPRINGAPALTNVPGFATLALYLDSLGFNNDTFAFYYNFYLNDSIAINQYNFPNIDNIDCGLMYTEKMNPFSLCIVRKYGDFLLSCTEAISKEVYDTTTLRTLKPLQPEVITYINDNKQILNKWFYNEALKKGVIK